MKSKRTPNVDLETIIPVLMGVWRRLHKEAGPADRLQTREFRGVVTAINALQEGLITGNSLIGTDYFSDNNMLGAYLLYQWMIHYQQGLSLIGELPVPPNRVLDICSGPAPFAFAALRHGAGEVFATDRNAQALKIGAEVCGRYGVPINTRQWDCLKERCPVDGSFDLIILGHCLEELFPSDSKGWIERQHQFLTFLLSRLSPQGYLMIAESSHIEANQRVLSLRDKLVKEGVPVQAPCIWRGDCPVLQIKNSPCYAQRALVKPHLMKEIQRAAQINLGSLKMSYMIFRKPEANWPNLPNKELYRVISPPVESHQGNRYYLCGTNGKKSIGSHLKEHPNESKAFEFLKRGELISIENALEKQLAFDIVKGTKIFVEAACGKPLEDG